MPGTPRWRAWSRPAAAASYMNRMVIVVDDDIDITNASEVMWALATRWDPRSQTDIIDGCWTGHIDPRLPPRQARERRHHGEPHDHLRGAAVPLEGPVPARQCAGAGLCRGDPAQVVGCIAVLEEEIRPLRRTRRRPGPWRVEDARDRAYGAGTQTIRAFTPVFDGLWQPIERARRMGPCFRRDDTSGAIGSLSAPSPSW